MSGAGHIPESKSIHYNTPANIIEGVKKVFGGQIDLDPCHNEHSIVGANRTYSLPTQDGLVLPWSDKGTFFNCPFGPCYYKNVYGRTICLNKKEYRELTDEFKRGYYRKSVYDWALKASKSITPIGVIGLIPAYLDSKTWQDVVFPTARIVCFIKGRVSFTLNGEKQDSAPMGCALVYWTDRGSSVLNFYDIMSVYGHCEKINR